MREYGRARAKNCGTLAGLLFGIAACGAPAPGPAPNSGPPVFIGGGTEVAGGAPIGASTGSSVGGAAGGIDTVGSAGPGVTCAVPQVSDPVFAPQILGEQPARSELYTWLTDEQAAALRTSQVLFPSNAIRNPIDSTLQTLSYNSDATAAVAKALSASLGFSRSVWPEPWALRIGLAGEDPGRNLLRIVLKPEAWVAVVAAGSIQVLDLQNQVVPLADAAASPERLGAILHSRDSFEGGPDCNLVGGNSSVGYREFIVSNLSMVQEWSLGTAQIKARLQDNIAQLSLFFARTRACPDQSSEQSWNQQVVCGWQVDTGASVTELAAYQRALAIPTADYFDAPPQLAALIDKLSADVFEPDPLVVTPGSL